VPCAFNKSSNHGDSSSSNLWMIFVGVGKMRNQLLMIHSPSSFSIGCANYLILIFHSICCLFLNCSILLAVKLKQELPFISQSVSISFLSHLYLGFFLP
jgi:hypothetical protein